jgi:hypothetical protein
LGRIEGSRAWNNKKQPEIDAIRAKTRFYLISEL